MQALGQIQQGSGGGSEGSEKVWEALVGFGAKPSQVQQGSGEGSSEGRGGFGAEPGHVQQGSGEGSTGFRKKKSEKVWEALVQSQGRFNRICGHLTHGNPAEVFLALGFAARFRKICKNKTLQLSGIPPKLIFDGNCPEHICKHFFI